MMTKEHNAAAIECDFDGVRRSIEEIKSMYPDQWILIGDPIGNEGEMEFISGVVLYHSPDKREVAYLGRPRIEGYQKTAMFFNRVTPRTKRPAIVSIYSTLKL
jgi:hypothetical protein